MRNIDIHMITYHLDNSIVIFKLKLKVLCMSEKFPKAKLLLNIHFFKNTIDQKC